MRNTRVVCQPAMAPGRKIGRSPAPAGGAGLENRLLELRLELPRRVLARSRERRRPALVGLVVRELDYEPGVEVEVARAVDRRRPNGRAAPSLQLHLDLLRHAGAEDQLLDAVAGAGLVG